NSTTPDGVGHNPTRASGPESPQSPPAATHSRGFCPRCRTIRAPSATRPTGNRNDHTGCSSLQLRLWRLHTTPSACCSLLLIVRSPSCRAHTPTRSPPALDGRTAPQIAPGAGADGTNLGDASAPATHSL